MGYFEVIPRYFRLFILSSLVETNYSMFIFRDTVKRF